MTRAPPAAAAWLLRRLVAADRSDALLGDLFEEYQAGRTTGWYWRETLIALFISMRQGVARALACPRSHFILALLAQSVLIVWISALAQQYPQQCPALPTLLSGSMALVLSLGLIQIAMALLTWFRPLGRHVRLRLKSGLIRLSLAALIALGFGGGALTWAGTSACTVSPSVCSSSSTAEPCIAPSHSN